MAVDGFLSLMFNRVHLLSCLGAQILFTLSHDRLFFGSVPDSVAFDTPGSHHVEMDVIYRQLSQEKQQGFRNEMTLNMETLLTL